MARTCEVIPYTCSWHIAKDKVEEYLKEQKFKQITTKNGEKVWKCGTGIATSIKFIKPEFAPGQVTVYAWIAGVGLGNKSAIEVDLKGFYGSQPKKQLKKVIDDIRWILR